MCVENTCNLYIFLQVSQFSLYIFAVPNSFMGSEPPITKCFSILFFAWSKVGPTVSSAIYIYLYIYLNAPQKTNVFHRIIKKISLITIFWWFQFPKNVPKIGILKNILILPQISLLISHQLRWQEDTGPLHLWLGKIPLQKKYHWSNGEKYMGKINGIFYHKINLSYLYNLQ